MDKRHKCCGFKAVWVSTFVIALMALSATAARSDVAIGVAGPMTGSGAQYGELFKKGAETAAAEINEKGGVLGHKIIIRAYDDKNNPTEAANVAQKISTEKDVVGVIGHFTTSATYAAIPTYQKNSIPLLVVSATDPTLTKQGNTFVFRICITQEIDGAAPAIWLVNKMGKKKVAAIYVNTDYGKAHFSSFSKAFLGAGGEIAIEERYQPGTVDFSPVLIKIKNSPAEAIELGTYYNDVALIAKQARKLGITLPFVASGAALAPALIELGGEAVEGMFINQLPTGPRTDQASSTYKKIHKVDQVPAPQFTLACYDAVHFVAEAVKRGNSTSKETIRKTLSAFKDFPTTSGYATFDGDRQVGFSFMDIVQVKSGRFIKVGSTQ
jgi:branched-chain amino acid transport system substrate-binding protein